MFLGIDEKYETLSLYLNGCQHTEFSSTKNNIFAADATVVKFANSVYTSAHNK